MLRGRREHGFGGDRWDEDLPSSEREASRNIPSQVKRAVRKQCGFGCAICGAPVFQYDHIVRFSEVKAHEESNIVLLCEMHHAAKTTGKLSVERIQKAKEKPFNIGRTGTSGYQIEHARKIDIKLGSNSASCYLDRDMAYIVLAISKMRAFILHSIDGWLTVSFVITDDIGQPMMIVSEGEITVSTALWDYEYVGTRLKIRTREGQIFADITLSDSEVTIHRGQVVAGRIRCIVTETGMLLAYCDNEPFGCLSGCSASENQIGSYEFYDATNSAPLGGFGWSQGTP